jgi:hypothetical protein
VIVACTIYIGYAIRDYQYAQEHKYDALIERSNNLIRQLREQSQ